MGQLSVSVSGEGVDLLARDDFSQLMFTFLPDQDFEVREVLNKSANKLYLVTQGRQQYLLKSYRGEGRYGQLDKRFGKEVFCLQHLAGKKMAPELCAYSAHEKILLMGFVSGARVGDMISAQNMSAVAVNLGTWLARFHALFQEQRCQVNALAYFKAKYNGRIVPSFDGSDCQRALGGVTFTRAVLCKNDSHKHNFIIDDEANVYGIDFEFARYAPPHVDLADVARSLVSKSVAPIQQVVDCLCEGYSKVPGASLDGGSGREIVDTLVLSNLDYLTEKKNGYSEGVCT